MSTRHTLSLITVMLIIVILYLSRQEVAQAWALFQKVNLGILAFIIPLQAISYYAVGAMIFSYIKQKEKLRASSLEMAKMALELNFVNHLLPSGGVSGASYMTWRLKHLGIGAGRATLAQGVRFVATFGAFLILLFISLIAITLDGQINRLTILVTSVLVTSIVFGLIGIIYVIDSDKRLHSFSRKSTALVNTVWMKWLRQKQPLMKQEEMTLFFSELHEDYRMIKQEPRLLIRPFMWGLLFNICEVGMFVVAFWALGTPINPAPLLIAYGIASIAGFFIVTPGGVGGYEALMIAFLASAGIPQAATFAAVLLTRTLLILTTIISGYAFYQLALGKYGKRPVTS